MIRRGLLMFVALLAAMALLVPTAAAQDDDDEATCSYNNTNACRLAYPSGGLPDTSPDQDLGDLSSAFANQGGPSADVIPAVPTPVPADAAATTDQQAPQLAFTGDETGVLAWIGSGMIAAGAAALAVRRRIED